MRVEIVPCLRDNYAYLLIDDRSGVAVVVDASEEAPVERALARTGARLAAILSTHHHPDHVGGNLALRARRPGLAIHGHEREPIAGLDAPHAHGDRFGIEGLDGVEIEALHVPGHTLGALTYVVRQAAGPAWAFTGDTLFLAGCGRLFEGTAAQMHDSLARVLGALPDDVLVACGHEYTEANLRFARHVEPDSVAIAARADDASARRARGEPTVPAPLGLERATNPFLRVDAPEVRAHVHRQAGLALDASPSEVFGALRAEKDRFR